MQDFEFQQPVFALLFLIVPLLFGLVKKFKKDANSFVIPILSFNNTAQKNKKTIWLYISNIIQIVSICLVIFALMQPILKNTKQLKHFEGIDIMLAIDCSNSMLAVDIKPNRIEVAKKTAITFIKKRENDKIGANIFAGESATISPLTINHLYLIQKINDINIQTAQLADGTAIGVGIATALLRLQDSDAKSKIIILLTDGVNNTGNILPTDAMNIAKKMGVKIYAVAIGKDVNTKISFSKNEIYDVEGVFDTSLLKEIAKETNGRFFEATSFENLTKIYDEIDKLETTSFYFEEVSQVQNLNGYLFSVLLLLVISELIIRLTILKYI